VIRAAWNRNNIKFKVLAAEMAESIVEGIDYATKPSRTEKQEFHPTKEWSDWAESMTRQIEEKLTELFENSVLSTKGIDFPDGYENALASMSHGITYAINRRQELLP
jgi:hypothetical protein